MIETGSWTLSNTGFKETRVFLNSVQAYHSAIIHMHWHYMYPCAYGEDCTSQVSSMDKGSLFQLQNQLGQMHVTKLVKANVFAAEVHLEVITQGHVVAAAMDVRQVVKLEDLVLVSGQKVSSLSQQIVDDLLAPIFG